jgi:hypothetical protein
MNSSSCARNLTFAFAARAATALLLAVFALAPGRPQGAEAAVQQVLVAQVDPGTLVCAVTIDFESESAGNYDNVLTIGNAGFAERFAGQTLGASGEFDTLSGVPTDPLTLQTGATDENVAISNVSTNVIAGLGPPPVFPAVDNLGEGSLAVLFDFDQSQVGFDVYGSDDGDATIEFFTRGGASLGVIALSSLSDGPMGFERAGGIADIAGFSIYNTDPAGIAYDNVCYNVASASATPTPSPTPTATATASPTPTATATPDSDPDTAGQTGANASEDPAAAPSELPVGGGPPSAGASGLFWTLLFVGALAATSGAGLWLARRPGGVR